VSSQSGAGSLELAAQLLEVTAWCAHAPACLLEARMA
jgi:hypothetical protein